MTPSRQAPTAREEEGILPAYRELGLGFAGRSRIGRPLPDIVGGCALARYGGFYDARRRRRRRPSPRATANGETAGAVVPVAAKEQPSETLGFGASGSSAAGSSSSASMSSTGSGSGGPFAETLMLCTGESGSLDFSVIVDDDGPLPSGVKEISSS